MQYEPTKYTQIGCCGGGFIIVLGLFVYFFVTNLFIPAHMDPGTFNVAIEEKIQTVLNTREDIGYLVSLDLSPEDHTGHKVLAKTSKYKSLAIVFDQAWNLKTIANQKNDDILYIAD